MNKKTFITSSISIIILTVLFIASSTDLIIKEKENIVYEISVVIDSDSDIGWENFKQGLDYASKKYNTDINFITLYESNSPWQQISFLEREIQNGTEGIIIQSENPFYAQSIDDTIPINVPAVVFGSPIDSPRIKFSLTPCYEQMAKDIANEALKSIPVGYKVNIVTTNENRENSKIIYNTISSFFKEKGYETAYIKLDSLEECSTLVSGLNSQGGNIIIACETDLLDSLSMANKSINSKIAIYGFGWSGNIWHNLENGYIKATAVYDDFSAGYLCVKALFDFLSSKSVDIEKTDQLKYKIITKTNIYYQENEMMLFPID